MYFGGEQPNFQPNPYRSTERTARFDHLWPGRTDSPQLNDKQQYADELKRQIDEKKERQKREKEYLLSGDLGFSTRGSETFPRPSVNQEPPPKSQPLASTYSNINRISETTNDISSNFNPSRQQSLISKSNLATGTISDNSFTQTLKAQIEECRKSSYSSLSQPLQPLHSTQPLPTLPSPSFEISDLDMPNLTIFNRMNRGVSDRHIYSVTMSGASSMRNSLEQTRMLPPIIPIESPMNRSKIVTPSMGFSTRPSNFPIIGQNSNSTVAASPYNTKLTANYSKTTYDSKTPINPNYNSQPLASTYGNSPAFLNNNRYNTQKYSVSALASTTKPSYEQPVRPTAKKLLSESQMIYADGHRSPV